MWGWHSPVLLLVSGEPWHKATSKGFPESLLKVPDVLTCFSFYHGQKSSPVAVSETHPSKQNLQVISLTPCLRNPFIFYIYLLLMCRWKVSAHFMLPFKITSEVMGPLRLTLEVVIADLWDSLCHGLTFIKHQFWCKFSLAGEQQDLKYSLVQRNRELLFNVQQSVSKSFNNVGYCFPLPLENQELQQVLNYVLKFTHFKGCPAPPGK